MTKSAKTNASFIGDSRLTSILLGVVLAYCISLVVFVFSSLLFTLTPLTEAIMPYITYITTVISIFIGGIYTAGKIGYKGWLNGGICGLIYLIGLFILSLLLNVNVVFGLQLLSRIVLSFLIGAIGGILGINM
ncbi:TIGR04086 family membrane protein [Natranaerobius trueperi]|uniref:TIGR04086 family membrane protein n=1 Tax=Natranaerobius trueperi TaxID=759412 RepID=UPI0013038D0E|nr:TIGR04086 family membrane protein [Natranaerobius trueperi]